MFNPRLENLIYHLVDSGEFKIDGQGRIWKKGKRVEHKARGYLQIRKMIKGRRYCATAHRVVYRHFIGVIPKGLTINHKNGIKDDNRPENLELATYSQQSRHMRDILGKSQRIYNQYGEDNTMTVLKEKDVLQIRRRWKQGELQVTIAKDYPVTFQTISRICRRDTWAQLT